ncbi:MAG: FkbM family methyltransferase [Caulobacteraceae bacterium]
MGQTYLRATQAVKSLLYGRTGEPYRVNGQVLRFAAGTRPVRLRYASSPNAVNRYDALQIKLILERVREGDFCLDVGGHVGAVALIMAVQSGHTGRVITFEPDPYSRAVMERNFSLNPHVRRPDIEPMAISDVSKTLPFYSDGGHANSSLTGYGVGQAEQLTVHAVTLNDYLASVARPPSLVKIDIEGAEVEALKGATNLLAGQALIVCELHPYAWRTGAFDELLSLVSAYGRRMRYLDRTDDLRVDPVYGTVAIEPRT